MAFPAETSMEARLWSENRRLVAHIDAALRLHWPHTAESSAVMGHPIGDCYTCKVPHPCQTAIALGVTP